MSVRRVTLLASQLMGDGEYRSGAVSRDARAAALADYLRAWARSFSLSADVTALESTARAGMALLDAAEIAAAMLSNDPRLRQLSEAGRFESVPRGRARFIDSAEIRSAVQRPLVSSPQSGPEIIRRLVVAANAGGEAGDAGRLP